MIRLWLVLAMAGLVSCSPSEEPTEVYSVLHDITDVLQASPEADALWQFVGGDDTDKHLHIRYSTLSGVDMNSVHNLERPAKQSGLMANAVQEKKRCDAFKREFTTFFQRPDSIGQSHSAIFKPILAELDYLASLPDTDEKHLIVYSDLMENSDWLSFYVSKDLWQLRHQPEAIMKRYRAQVPEDMRYEGIRLHIIYQPQSFKDNIQFKQLRAVYSEVFKPLGVPISFSANLPKAGRGL